MDFRFLFFEFDGRIGRRQWWIGVLLVLAANLVAGALFGPGLVMFLVWVVLVIASLALHVKRFHDRGKSGWWVLVFLIPVIGLIWMIVEMGLLEGEPGPNLYGPPPREPA